MATYDCSGSSVITVAAAAQRTFNYVAIFDWFIVIWYFLQWRIDHFSVKWLPFRVRLLHLLPPTQSPYIIIVGCYIAARAHLYIDHFCHQSIQYPPIHFLFKTCNPSSFFLFYLYCRAPHSSQALSLSLCVCVFIDIVVIRTYFVCINNKNRRKVFCFLLHVACLFTFGSFFFFYLKG